MYMIIKRVIDIIASLTLILVLSPLFLIIMLVIYLQDGACPIFFQQRVGKNGEIFTLYKFRSMPPQTPNVQSSKVELLNITPFGKILRRTNIDELPQLLNIFKGDMSIIGPRPSLCSQNALTELRKRNGTLNIRPGLTGWAQVNSYDFMPEAKKAELDSYYAQNINLIIDIRIVLKTLKYLTKTPPVY